MRKKSEPVFFEDKFDRDALYRHRVFKELANERSKYQHIRIFRTQYGSCLTLDGYPQIAETDTEYTESLVAPGILALGTRPKRVLVLGGGDGAALKLILADQTVTEAWLVDIDERVLELTQKHMPLLWGGVLKDTRFHLVVGDALKFLRGYKGYFDLIISDLTDPEESAVASPVMCDEYFVLLRSRLEVHGILAMQAGQLTRYRHAGHKLVRALARKQFQFVTSAAVHVPWFSTNWGFIFASRYARIARHASDPDMRLALDDQPRFARALKFIDENSLASIFALGKGLTTELDA